MSSPVRLASFCRLCLTKTKDKVPVFENGSMLDNLLHLIEILIDPDDEPDAVVCYDCVVTLEGFHQFKEQCHLNDEFVRTVPTKLDDSASAEEIEEENEDDDNREGFLEEEAVEEEDRLELSEAEEVFQKNMRRSVKSNKKNKKKPVKSSKKSSIRKPVKKPLKKATPSKDPQGTSSNNTSVIDELQVLADSYPDYFYFEKGSRSIYYTIVFYGERFNSALFTERFTYWQCIHRRKYQCPAQVKVSNDYKTFERRYEHTHGQLIEKEGQAFTPHEALPEMFQICKRIVRQKRAKNAKHEVSFADKFQEFAADKLENDGDDNEPASPLNDSKLSLPVDDSNDDAEVIGDSRPKRKIRPNTRYEPAQNQPKKRTLEPETKTKKQAVEKSDRNSHELPSSKKSKMEVEEKREYEERKSDDQDTDEDDMEDDIGEEEEEEEEDLDLDKIEEECEALNVPKKPPSGPSLDDQLVLADSYPDFFFFEKGPRSVYFTLVYYGERYHSALFTQHYTYWQCRHRRKYRCPAQVCVTNDYKTFERRYEHTHPDLPDKEGEAFTPMEALPELFEGCRKVVLKNRAKRRKKLLEKYKSLKAANSANAQLETSQNKCEEVFIEVEDDDDEIYDETLEDEIMLKDVEYVEELIEMSED